MYKLLLCWRYLKTRWIALASIVSVTLGVATMIVVNSVMDGFTQEMQQRIHGILSDIVVESHSSEGINDVNWYQERIQATLGDRLEGMTTVVAVPAMVSFQYNGAPHTQQINLIGIDTATYASVSDFSQYLLHPDHHQQLAFNLKDGGYAPDRKSLPESGWAYRRDMARLRKELEQESKRNHLLRRQVEEAKAGAVALPAAMAKNEADTEIDSNPSSEDASDADNQGLLPGPTTSIAESSEGPHYFDAEKETHPGIVLGISIGSMRYRDPLGEVKDLFFIRPGDDVTVTMPGAGSPPRAIDQSFTVVDLYESKMSEYDSTFAFIPLEKLQQARGMIDPISGKKSVTSIQLKLKPKVDLAKARDDLRAAFPPDQTMVHVESWRDSQGPLLAAVQLETTILNILLFMIIAVAGFGILATFFMIVVEKTRDIGILKSLGAPGSGIASIFLAYGVLLGMVGSGAGAVLGLLFVHNINRIAALIEKITGREVFDPTVYYFTEIPTIIHPFMIVWVVFGAILIAVMASVLPSIRAARMHPVEALRYE
ncbi:MAG: FtsX-like permease family protein [Pirellulaceae bacterium]|nr:FtsX-like permease family protein [Pirellulaceae bacterium]